MTTQETPKREDGRRRVLTILGLAGGAAAAPAAAFNADGSRKDLPNRPESEAEKRRPRYRETEHVQAFYRTNRD